MGVVMGVVTLNGRGQWVGLLISGGRGHGTGWHFEKVGAYVTVKLKSRVTEKSLDYIDQFWRSIADHFLLPSLSALLDSIREGCVEVTWLVPTLSALQIQANIQDSTQFLEKLQVIRVIMEGEILYDEEGLEEVRILKLNHYYL